MKSDNIQNKKVLIIGPFGKKGGREVEANLIYHFLKNTYSVEILTTGIYDNKSDVINNDSSIKYTGLDLIIYKTKPLIRFFLFILNIFKRRNTPLDSRLGNSFFKKYLGINKIRRTVLAEQINKCDVVFICAQLSSGYIRDIINIAEDKSKKVIFRVTGTIFKRITSIDKALTKVSLFVFHSKSNQNNFENYYFKHPYVIIDQCTLLEKQLVSLPINIKEPNFDFFTVSRLSAEKNIFQVINAFKTSKLKTYKLHIYGDGELKSKVENEIKGYTNIVYHGHVTYDKLPTIFNKHNCLIISSTEETGPLSGIEAMAAGKAIISTKVGAMTERLGQNGIWYNGSTDKLISTIENMCKMSSKKKKEMMEINRAIYMKNYSNSVIQKKYLEIVYNI